MHAAARTADAPSKIPSQTAKTVAHATSQNQISAVTNVLLQRSPTCACGGGCPSCEAELAEPKVQTKLAVSSPGDKFEQEADAVADQVMRTPDPVLHSEHTGPRVQRLETSASSGAIGSDFTSHLGGGVPLDTASRTYFESRFGYDFSGVRLHTDEAASDSARAVQARAYTLGRDIVFGAGEYEPSSFAGKQLLAHELAHVVQQSNHARPVAQRQSEAGPSALSPLSGVVLQRQTPFTPGVNHNHRPSRRWRHIQEHPNSRWYISWVCLQSTPREVAEAAMRYELNDKPLALRHLRWYLSAGGRDFPENENLERLIRISEQFRRDFATRRRGQRGFMDIPQGSYGPNAQDYRFSFGAIDRMDYEFDDVTGTAHLWFKDRYEYHPFYPGLYSVLADDEARDSNCVHAAMVELKDQGAADFWMIGEATVPARLFAISGSDIMHEERSDSVRSAMDFLNTLRRNLEVDRLRARNQARVAGGAAEASRRAHAILNQAGIRTILRSGSQVYEAQHTLAQWGTPLRERIREVYFSFLGEVRAAIDESLSLSRNDQAAEREEEAAYGENLLLWMEASPMREAAMAGQTGFISTLQREEGNLTSVLTNLVPNLNFAVPGMPDRARNAIRNAIGRDATSGFDPYRTWTVPGPVLGLADAAFAQIDQIEQTMNRGRVLLRAAIARLAVWLQAPAQPIDVADRVDELFHTRDAGYGQLLQDRLQLMLDNIEGRGQLNAHTHRSGDTAHCTTPTTLGQMPRAYEFIFCRFSTNVDSNASTMLHEVAHAVIPGRGTHASATSGSPIDRAYEGERLMLRMTTEEALNNAESYAQLIAVLAGLTPATIPTDTVTGCTDSGPWLDAMALAQSAHRRAWSYLEEARDALDRGVAIEPWLRTLIDRHLGTPSDTQLRGMLTDFGHLQAEGSVWHSGHTFSCAPGRSCPANALAFDNRRIYRDGSVVMSSRAGSSAPRICPAFFNLSTADDRARAAHVIVSRSFGDFFLIHKDRVWGYAALALEIYRRDIGAPPASSLAEHQAADRPPSAAPPPSPPPPSAPPTSSPFSEHSHSSPPPP